ncbi:MAG: TIGR00299 family protein, partial [Candidatus Aenigmatarchaeota archaeon]
FDVRVKVSKTKTGKIINVKPEYEDLRKISEELNIPLRKVLKKVEEQLKDYQQQ